MRTLSRILAVAGLVLVLLVAVLETVPRFVSIPGLRPADLDPAAEEVRKANVVPHPYLAYAGTPNYSWRGPKRTASHNSMGFRGPEIPWEKPPGTYRILCLGGSSTYGHGPTSNETTWPARLEHHLAQARPDEKVQVINGGCRGYSTFEILGNLAFRGLDLEPDLVIVYETINDARCALYKQPTHDNTHWRSVWKLRAPSPLEKSITFLIARAHLTGYLKELVDLGTYVIVDFDGKDYYDWEPGQDLGFRNIHRNLQNIVTLASSNGARVILGKQALRRSDLDGARTRDDQLRAFDYVTEILGIVARQRDVLLVDGQTPLEQEALRRTAAGRDPKEDGIFTHEVHLTDEGADMLARTFADAILEAGLLDPR